jgi:small-conductance mechanosensitive channel
LFSFSNIDSWLVPVSLLLGGLLIGFVCEKLLLPLILRTTKKIHFESATRITHSLRGMVFLWGFLAGFEGALTWVSLKPDLTRFFNHLLVALFVFSLTVVLARISVDFFDLHAKKKAGDTPTISLFTLIIKLLVYSIGVLVILQSLGISIAPALTALGVGGLAVALALQETLSNLFAGMQILAAKQVKQGDFVHLETGEEGYVIDVTWRNTIIKAVNENMIIVPNSKLASTILTNYHQPFTEMLVFVPVGVHYDSDLEHVERVTLEVARDVLKTVDGANSDFEPRIRYNEFGGSSINFRAVLAVKEFFSSYLLTHEFVKRLHRRYDEEGIVIPFHMRTLHIPDNPRIRVQMESRDFNDLEQDSS